MSEMPLPRSQFPVTDRYRYFNHAGVAPLPVVARDAMSEIVDDFVNSGSFNFSHWEQVQEQARVRSAQLLGVPATDLAFVKNTTEGLGFVANGLRWEPGDRVVVPDLEFPSTIYPWLSLRELGVEVDIVEPLYNTHALPVDLFADVLETNESRGGTRLVAASWVQYARGYQLDVPALAALCHNHGTLLCLDAIQGIGAMPAALADWGVDFAMADSHKFMLGPLGIGVLYVAEGCRELLRPLEPGWASVGHRDDFEHLELVYDDSARRFEGGTYNNITICGMDASVGLLLEAGVERIWDHVDGLLSRLVTGLEDVGATVLSDRGIGRSGIVTFSVPGAEPATLLDALREDGFVLAHRGGGIRVAPHGYNTTSEVDALVKAIEKLSTTPA